MIKLTQVSKEYVISGNNKIEALRNVNLTLPDTGLIAIVGKSGSGKTTLLNLLGGIDSPTSGKIEVDGEELKYTNHELDFYRNYIVGIVFQDYNLLEDYNVLDNVKLGIEVQGIKKDAADSRAKEALKLVGLEDYVTRKISSLSGGQRQRVAIARALCKESKYVLCDEPTGNLDSKTSAEIFSLIKSLSKNRTFIVVTHDNENALKYADQIITISDGEIISVVENTSKDIEKKESLHKVALDVSTSKEKKTYGLNTIHCLQMIRHNITHSIFLSLIMFFVLAICFTLVTAFLSLSLYDEKDAYLNTLRSNNQYVLSVSKYIDTVRYTLGGRMYYGYSVSPSLVTEDDIEILQADMPEGVSVYPSYYFVKPLSDFGEIDLTIYNYTGYSYAFKEAIIVEDFSTFNSPLLYGNYPSEYNDVLIYDYMAYSLIEQGLFDVSVSEIVGKVLTDSSTGIELNISGVIGSNFEEYLNLTSSSKSYSFATTYLSTLNAMFCGPELIEEISSSSYAFSILNSYYINTEDSEKISISKKAGQYLESLDDLNIYCQSDFIDDIGIGIAISKNTLANFLDMSLTDINEQIAINFINNSYIEFEFLYATSGLNPTEVYSYYSQIIAITEDNFDDDDIIYFYAKDGFEYINKNGDFRQIYIGLSSNWSVNKSVIDYFWYAEEQDESFYEENPNYYDVVFSVYDPTGSLITSVNYFLVNVKVFAGIISYILLGFSAIAVFIYIFLSLKKYNYKIGVLKAIGAKTSNIVLIFGMQLILISLISFAISIPFSYLLLFQINGIFSQGINSSLVFFLVEPLALFISLVISFFGVLVVAGIPLLKLAISSPANTILASRKR